jgi:hypothetical protein
VAVSSEVTSYRDISWTGLSLPERDAAMVFASEKVLWSISRTSLPSTWMSGGE